LSRFLFGSDKLALPEQHCQHTPSGNQGLRGGTRGLFRSAAPRRRALRDRLAPATCPQRKNHASVAVLGPGGVSCRQDYLEVVA
jgi:hypothetical protein